MVELVIRDCPKCNEDKKILGRSVTIDVDGAPQEVCDYCALSSTKKLVKVKVGGVREEMKRWTSIDLSEHQSELDNVELYVEDADENLPDNWKEVAGNLLMARRIIFRVERQVREGIVTKLLVLVEQNLTKAGQIESVKPDDTERQAEQEKLDQLRAEIELNAKVAAQSLEDSTNRDLGLKPQDQRKLLGDARRQSMRAFFKSRNYLERKTEVDVEKLVEEAIGSDNPEESGDGDAPTKTKATSPRAPNSTGGDTADKPKAAKTRRTKKPKSKASSKGEGKS